jgi:hypothetical protein
MNIDLQSFADFAEIIGGLAVVISLVYLALQVRQNTYSLRTENYARALDRVAAIQAQLGQNSDLSRMLTKGTISSANLTSAERIQFSWCLYEIFGSFEFMFHAAETRALPDEVWERWSLAVAWWLVYPGVQEWWHARPIPFSSSFVSYVEKTLQDNPTDTNATERWRNFIEGAQEQGRTSATD